MSRVMGDTMIRLEDLGHSAVLYDLRAGRLEAIQIVRVWDRDPGRSCQWLAGRDCTHGKDDRCNAVPVDGGRWVCSRTIVGRFEMEDEELVRADLSALKDFPVFSPSAREVATPRSPGESAPGSPGDGPGPR